TWGRDADVTAAKTAGQVGNVSQQTGDIIDLNNYKTTGSYLFSSAQSTVGSNFPATNLVTWLMVISNGGSPTKQIAIIAGTNAMYQRYYAGATWGPWVRIGVPFPQAAAGIGQWTTLSGGTWNEAGSTYTPADCVLPAGGSWAYFYSVYNVVADYKCQYVEAGIAAGGTTLLAANAAREPRGFCWRIA
ncbi:pyocin knob domain-containing protein, partial [Cloacibacillus evryensis]|uniref:pyocin knob domain-containing protein n=1 Tax=Cloacibacillus evryensis TaxID=508460 RepID=UPI00267169FB